MHEKLKQNAKNQALLFYEKMQGHPLPLRRLAELLGSRKNIELVRPDYKTFKKNSRIPAEFINPVLQVIDPEAIEPDCRDFIARAGFEPSNQRDRRGRPSRNDPKRTMINISKEGFYFLCCIARLKLLERPTGQYKAELLPWWYFEQIKTP